MNILECIDIYDIQKHLKDKKSGVKLDLQDMPGQPDEYRGFKCQLDESDVDKLTLWWEFETFTSKQNCKVSNLLPTATSLKRVVSFTSDSFDLRIAQNMEIVIVAESIQSKILYIIDGNHRTIAQKIIHDNFEGVSAFLCIHPKVKRWAYFPKFYKSLWEL